MSSEDEDSSSSIPGALKIPSFSSGLEWHTYGSSGMPLDSTPQSSQSETVSYRSRRTSARIMSLALRETLKKIRRNQHKALVQQLKEKHAKYYSRQRCCECITMTTLIVTFSVFAFYIVLSYGFYFGFPRPFDLAGNMTTRIVVQEKDDVDLLCQTDHPWEYCRWFHYDSFCDFERVPEGRIMRMDCDWPLEQVSFLGNYSSNECGIRLHGAQTSHRGIWQCEMEKYYLGFSRRYGELKTFGIMLVVEGDREDSAFTRITMARTTSSPVASDSFNLNNETDTESSSELSDEGEEYQRAFFFLRVFILGGMGFVLGSLALMFWFYFMYLWRSWESHGPGKIHHVGGSSSRDPSYSDHHRYDEEEEGDDDYEESSLPPEVTRTLYDSRRKSVSFAVMTASEDKNTYSLERKVVRLCNRSGNASLNSSTHCVIPSIITTSPRENSDPDKESETSL